MQRSLLSRVQSRAEAVRWKVADTESLDHVVDEFLLGLGHEIAHALGGATHAHMKNVEHKDHGGQHEVDVQVISRAGDLIHDFKVNLSIDHLNTIGILDYSSMDSGGGKPGRSKSMAFDLPSKATPEHFVHQIVEAALEQYQGKRAPVDVRMMAAAWKA